ncbi:MAG TPA: PilZ domain-containing protein [Turneriella sp.]|nr:PilZ domain-containing protein [Turneriella sp.]HMY11130.1 PilZ domain-containing protein [Turneriella sp.]HNA80714.1 PilZ domain-containing protein [Turneriella sp.]HNE21392.1 PilZ domain-containing protein [Turneriella sp.]HNL55786.1 PilZ domain-containing protein [Turneriella sp.]
MSTGQRQFKRLFAQRLGATTVSLNGSPQEPCTLMDISVGGLRLLFERVLPEETFGAGAPVKGKIQSSEPGFVLNFEGKVVWNRRAALVGEAATMIGVTFLDYTDLPETLLHLIDDFGQAD